MCVFHPDPVGSAGEKHVISAQPVRHGQSEISHHGGIGRHDAKIHTVSAKTQVNTPNYCHFNLSNMLLSLLSPPGSTPGLHDHKSPHLQRWTFSIV